MMNTRLSTALFLFVVASAAPAQAQQKSTDARWTPWLGCWQLVDESQRDANPGATDVLAAPAARRSTSGVSVCVTPASEPAGISLKTLVGSQSALEQTIVADGANHPITDADCRGTQQAEWSRTGARLLAHAQLVCGDQMPRNVSGLAMIAGSGIWVDVQVVETGGRESIRVRRYRRAPDQRDAPTAAGTPLTIDDVKEVSGKVSPSAVEAALIATNARFDLNSRRLIDLDDAGVTDNVIDLMVALSYPGRFVVERANTGGTGSSGSFGSFFDPFGASYLGSGPWSAAYSYSPYFYGSLMYPYGAYLYDAYYYSPFAYSYSGRDGLQYVPGSGLATGGGGGSGSGTVDNGGRAVNGVGYTRVRPREATAEDTPIRARQGGNTSNGGVSAAGGDSTSSGSSSGSSGGSSGGATSGGFTSGSSSGDTGRTAQPR
jgi:hypothetical protein